MGKNGIRQLAKIRNFKSFLVGGSPVVKPVSLRGRVYMMG